MVSTEKNVVGNKLSSSKEEFVSQYLKEENLDRVNRESDPVRPRNSIYTRYIKRIIDFLVGLTCFVAVSPINLILAVCTYFDVGWPILFKQTRIGKDGKEFEIVKFRNMTNETDESGKLLPASERVTKFGKFVRKFSLDELLNFWSVLKGDMSIIGPRPLPVFFEDRFSDRHKMRHYVRPGLECPRVLHDDAKPKYQAQFENDIWYVENVSFKTDMMLVWELVKMVFNFEYRSMGASAGSYFVGYNADNNAIGLKQYCKENPEIEALYESSAISDTEVLGGQTSGVI